MNRRKLTALRKLPREELIGVADWLQDDAKQHEQWANDAWRHGHSEEVKRLRQTAKASQIAADFLRNIANEKRRQGRKAGEGE